MNAMNSNKLYESIARVKAVLLVPLALLAFCVPFAAAQDKVPINIKCTMSLGGGTLPGQAKVDDAHRVTLTVTAPDQNGNPQDVTVQAHIPAGGTASAVGTLLAGALGRKDVPGATVGDQTLPPDATPAEKRAAKELRLPAGVTFKSAVVDIKKAEGFAECNSHLKVGAEKKKKGTDEDNGAPPPVSNMVLMAFATNERSAYALDLELTLMNASGVESKFAINPWFAFGTPAADARADVVAALEEFGLVAFSDGPFGPWILIDGNASGQTITGVRFGASTSFPQDPTLGANESVAAYTELYLF